MVLAGGATAWRDLPMPGRELEGIHQAMEYLPLANRVRQGDLDEPPITAKGKDVVVIGGGDTGADCLGTAHPAGRRARWSSWRSCRSRGGTRPTRSRGRRTRWS